MYLWCVCMREWVYVCVCVHTRENLPWILWVSCHIVCCLDLPPVAYDHHHELSPPELGPVIINIIHMYMYMTVQAIHTLTQMLYKPVNMCTLYQFSSEKAPNAKDSRGWAPCFLGTLTGVRYDEFILDNWLPAVTVKKKIDAKAINFTLA